MSLCSVLCVLCFLYLEFYHHFVDGSRSECPAKFPKTIPKWHELPTICNNLNQFKLHGVCNVENCSDCIPPTSKIMRAENAEIKTWQDAYKNTKDSRRKELSDLLTSHNITAGEHEDPIILMVINRGYLYLFYNFICSLDYNNIKGIKERILVIPSDLETKDMIEKAGILTFYPSFLGEKMLQKIDPKMAASFALGAHRWLQSFQIAFVSDLLHLGYDVLLQDSDVIWLRNAMDYLRQKHFEHLDILMSVDGRIDFRGPGNSGFALIKSTCKMKMFVDTMIELIGLVLVGRSDQIVWNMLLNEDIFRQIHFETLDTNYFICGYQINLDSGIRTDNKKLPETSLIIHASWTTDQFDKIEKFWISDTWYFSEERCPQLYEYDLLPDLAERKWHIRDKTQPQEIKFKKLGVFRDSTNGNYARGD